jgi:hypothetical protein
MWRDELRKRRGALLLAAQVDAVQTQHKALMVWRGTVRMHAKMGKHARMAERYFVLRRAWARWGELGRERERERKVRAFESAKVGKVFSGWLEKARRRRRLDLAENQVGMTVAAVGVFDSGTGKLDSMLMEWIADFADGASKVDQPSHRAQATRARDRAAQRDCIGCVS